jgi:hypothetical protein
MSPVNHKSVMPAIAAIVSPGNHKPAMLTMAAIVFLLSAGASTVLAQAQVRVVVDRALIWRREARIPATSARIGTVLDVVSREGNWYIVVIPRESGPRELGLIAVSQVEAVAGSVPLPPQRGLPPQREGGPPTASPGTAPRPAVSTHRPIELFGSGHVGYGAWLAHNTFNAVLGSSGEPVFGGAAQMRVHGRLFVEASVERFQRTGERVFVQNGQVFKLGITDTVRVIPVAVTLGYRHDDRHRTSYVGGGIGRYFYEERSAFADSSENPSERFTSYHALVGVEFANRAWLRTAVEAQFTSVPGALGSSGTAAAFGEHNLGGVQVRLKLLAGR